ncbi:conserved hypothetical protein [Mesorhizobium plurifarium]|uniref:DUF982 domain-containing protein n=1 Tax=Mesorhizobium plurifarium TaxID=69974 RepID=A0A0K2VUW3_MESPL|nr:conserved hypothetical protein [Mesorhizobium plurifarium]
MHWFDRVSVREIATGQTRGVNSVEAAIEEMQTWPKVGPKLRAAYPVCYGVVAGEEGFTVEQARAAFVAAAKEAKVLRAE